MPEDSAGLSPEEIAEIDYDLVITNDAILLSPDEAFRVGTFLKGIEEDSPYSTLKDVIQEQMAASWPTERQIELGIGEALKLAGTYVGLAWACDIADVEAVRKIRYKIDRLGATLSDAERAFIEEQLLELDKLLPNTPE